MRMRTGTSTTVGDCVGVIIVVTGAVSGRESSNRNSQSVLQQMIVIMTPTNPTVTPIPVAQLASHIDCWLVAEFDNQSAHFFVQGFLLRLWFLARRVFRLGRDDPPAPPIAVRGFVEAATAAPAPSPSAATAAPAPSPPAPPAPSSPSSSAFDAAAAAAATVRLGATSFGFTPSRTIAFFALRI